MPGEKTYYSRLRAVLESAASRRHGTLDALAESIIRRGPANFSYRRWDSVANDFTLRCSASAVHNTISLGVDLDFIDADRGQLSSHGRRALDPARFDDALCDQVGVIMKREGCSIPKLEELCLSLLKGRNFTLPTAEELYVRAAKSAGFTMDEKRFALLLRLLAWAGGLTVSRRAVYLPPRD